MANIWINYKKGIINNWVNIIVDKPYIKIIQ